ncbi:isoprenylcysteine carboxylmethyltransferase family protein [Deinococcus sp.]|uniref:isoprenylcysteine carboxyl methyltransferase family protein n=1 Tax=Deinococcus sp. TaxID=47478 RepID=UPI0025C044AB|nr:isoprenylcysteine carboxylmethyltransferase family protein [Deinococcus sp.]
MKASRLTPYLVGGLIAQRLLEVRHARSNERWAREHGAVEYGQGHYWTFFVLHPAWLLALLLEGRASRRAVNWPLVLLFLLLQPLRYLIMAQLGHYWNTKILIIPGGKRVETGVFRFLKHPNYTVVALELASAPLAVGAWRTALAFSLLNAALLLGVRIPAEEAALRDYDAAN